MKRVDGKPSIVEQAVTSLGIKHGFDVTTSKDGRELGGPWAFYHASWPAHNIEHLNDLYPPEAQVAGKTLWVPLIIRNDTHSPKQVELHSVLPPG